MNQASEIAALYRRDLTRLLQELEAFKDNEEALWRTLPGVTNSAGHLMIHLDGNLREYVGRRLGNIAFTRHREEEFTAAPVLFGDLVSRVENLLAAIPAVISGLAPSMLDAVFPDKLRGVGLSTQQYLIHTLSHFNYHLGQIDYLRRILLNAAAVEFAGL